MLEPTMACWSNMGTEQFAFSNRLQHQLNPPNITLGPHNLTCKALEAPERLLKDV